MRWAQRRDFTEYLPSIHTPTLVIAGATDPIAPAEKALSGRAKIEGASFVTIPDSAHLSPLENPDAFNAALAAFIR